MSHLVSVIIPVLNGESTITRCIDSVLHQTYNCIEILIVDNGSTDGTIEILESYNKLTNITVLHEPKKSACAARNLGLENARGKWIQFLDADDEILSEKIESQLLQIPSDMEIVVGAYNTIKNGSIRVVSIPNISIELLLITGRLGNTCSNLFKKESLVSIGGWNESLPSSQEYDLMFRLVNTSKARVFIHNWSLTNIYLTDNSISRDPSNQENNAVRRFMLQMDMIHSFSDRLNSYELRIAFSYAMVTILDLSTYNQALANKLYSEYLTNAKLVSIEGLSLRYLFCKYIFGFKLLTYLKSKYKNNVWI